MDKNLVASFDEYLSEYWKRNPVVATVAGIHDYDGELGDFSECAVKDDIEWSRGELARFEGFDSGSLPKEDAEDLRLIKAMIRTELFWMEEIQTLMINPVLYAELCIYGCYLLCVREYAPLDERLNSVVKRLSFFENVLGDAKSNLKNPPRLWTELALEMTEGGIGFVRNALPPLFENKPALKKDFEGASIRANAALEGYARFLKEGLLSRSLGAYAIGQDRFDFLLREQHMLDHTGDSLLAFGEEWVAKAEEDLVRTAREIDPKKSWPEIIEEHKSDHPEPGELLDFYRDRVESAMQFVLDKRLVTLADVQSLEVVPTPEFERAFLPYAAYMPPAAFEKEQKGLFFVTPVDQKLTGEEKEQQLKGHCKYKATVTALHEAYPGHHLQLTRSNTHPSKIRRLYGNNVFVEGWALYCEEMMYEQGYYPDAITRLFQLKDTLWRACRVVLDVRLHHDMISFDDACGFLAEKARIEKVNARKEVCRYTLNPTQPMSYLVGREELRRLREEISRKEGREFDLGRFHDWLLSHGSVPVGLISTSSVFS